MDELIEFMFYLKQKEQSAKTAKGFFNENSKNYKHWNDWEYYYQQAQNILSHYIDRRTDFLNAYGTYKNKPRKEKCKNG